jgi:hypothetical protein
MLPLAYTHGCLEMSLVSEEQLKYEGRERQSLLSTALDKSGVNLSFTRITTSEQAQNFAQVLRNERRYTLCFMKAVDPATFMPTGFYIATRDGEDLNSGLKFHVDAGLAVEAGLLKDYRNQPSINTEAVLKVLANTHEVESEDYIFAGVITKTAEEIVVPETEQ